MWGDKMMVASLEFAKNELLTLLDNLKQTSAAYSLYLTMGRDIGRVKNRMAVDTKMTAEMCGMLLAAI